MSIVPSVRRVRTDKHWSVYRLAKEAGVSRSYSTALERGAVDNPGLDTLSKILKTLGVMEACIIHDRPRYRLSLKITP